RGGLAGARRATGHADDPVGGRKCSPAGKNRADHGGNHLGAARPPSLAIGTYGCRHGGSCVRPTLACRPLTRTIDPVSAILSRVEPISAARRPNPLVRTG